MFQSDNGDAMLLRYDRRMEITVSLIAFVALVASWFALPASPPAARAASTRRTEGLAEAA